MSAAPPRRTGRLARWPRLQQAAAWLRRLYSPSLRQVHQLRRERAADLLQPFPDTRLNRHPALFRFAQTQLSSHPQPTILSFGCSTGEEALTLSRYLPGAVIDGVDINPRAVARARALVTSQGADKVTIVHAAAPPDRAALYDAVFCLSVLRHGELDAARPHDCSAVLPFARFAEVVAMLDAVLRPGGLLFIWGSNFRFADAPAADRYQVVAVPEELPHAGAVYGPDNHLLDQNGNAHFVFRKLRAA